MNMLVRNLIGCDEILNSSIYNDGVLLVLDFAGSQLALDAETVQGVLAACRQEIG